MKILSISSPGGDRGPAVGYRNHLRALSEGGFRVEELTQKIWENPMLMKSFDVAWAYVRFHPAVYSKCLEIGLPVIGGPNIALERADLGITDDWERWYLTQSNVSVNLNVAEYYTNRVSEFVTSKMKCRTLEYCYESEEILALQRAKSPVDVLIYEKDRVNDGKSSSRIDTLQRELDKAGMTHRTVQYGSHTREEYIRECLGARVCAWLSIEDYCSLAQIEAHLAGCCVVGSPYNLTIPTVRECTVEGVQTIRGWVTWEDDSAVARGYADSISRVLQSNDLPSLTRDIAKRRHSFEYYRTKSFEVMQEIL